MLLALAALALFYRLDAFPALSGDEAWIGMFATRVLKRGLHTPHEMNTYTGALYAFGLAGVFKLAGIGVPQLRLLGAAANSTALGFGGRWLALLALGSVYYMTKSRLAWEVYALQPLLIGASWWCLTRKRGVFFVALTALGAQNHFIYISIPLSLVLLYDHLEDDERRRIALAGLAASAVIYLVKPRLPEAGWQWYWLLLAALPALALAPWRMPRLPKALWYAVGAFAAWHGLAFLQVLAGPLVWKRVISWDAPWWYDLPLYAWGLFLAGTLAWRGYGAWRRKDDALALWPFAYMAVFLLFRHTSSLRYYSPLHFISLLALADGLARFPEADRKPLWRLGLAAALLVQVPLWRELASPADRRPLTFRTGWRLENSWDFARKDALFAAYDASGKCDFVQGNSFVDLPLFFHRESRGPRPCEPGTFHGDYRHDGPPWHQWAAHPLPSSGSSRQVSSKAASRSASDSVTTRPSSATP